MFVLRPVHSRRQLPPLLPEIVFRLGRRVNRQRPLDRTCVGVRSRNLLAQLLFAQCSNDVLHNWRAHGVSEKLDPVPPGASLKPISRSKAHCPSEFRDLKHPQRGCPVVPFDEPKSIQSGHRAQRTVKALPASRTVAAIVDDKKGNTFAQVGDRSTRPLESRLRSFLAEERFSVPRSRRIDEITDGQLIPIPDPRDWCRIAFQVARYEQPPTTLWNTKVCGIQHLNAHLVRLLDLRQQGGIPRPAPHLTNILDDDPPWRESPCEVQNKPSRSLAVLIVFPAAAGARVIGALGRSEKKIDRSEVTEHFAIRSWMQRGCDDMSVWKIVPEREARDVPGIYGTYDIGSRKAGTPAASSASAEQVECTHRHPERVLPGSAALRQAF